MARYTMTFKEAKTQEVLLYMQSTAAEDDPEQGDGYMHFWTRCKKAIIELETSEGVKGFAELEDNWNDTTRRI